jgi:geranylgeranyl diphosphate synthase type I
VTVTNSEQRNPRGAVETVDIDELIAAHMAAAVDVLDGPAPLLAGMGRYHLGWVDREFTSSVDGLVDKGKRVRPLIAILCCAAAGGKPEDAAPLAAAVELLHNFTLVHDDIQDQSPTRRHRATVWSLWGPAQAINAGDALFAAAHIALYRLRRSGNPAELVLRLAEAFDRMTIEIVAGQVLDLSFEDRADVAPAEYLRMIAGKTAAIVRYAAWAGALLGGADEATADRFGAFGLALGLGFQVQDDLRGVWGSSEQSGKAAAVDIRRKKQSLPILLLRAAADNSSTPELARLYDAPEIDPAGVVRVLALLERFGNRKQV